MKPGERIQGTRMHTDGHRFLAVPRGASSPAKKKWRMDRNVMLALITSARGSIMARKARPRERVGFPAAARQAQPKAEEKPEKGDDIERMQEQ